MPARPTVAEHEAELLRQLGERLRLARLRRELSAEEVARRVGIARVTLHRLESGAPAATLGTAVKVMAALDLAQDWVLLARDDRHGRDLQDARLPPRRAAGALGDIRIGDLPQLRAATWSITDDNARLTPKEVFDLYERNWRHIDRGAMTRAEAKVLERLAKTVGKGVLLV